VKDSVPQEMSCWRVGGFHGHEEERVGFAGFFGNEPSRFVKCLYKELFMWVWSGG